MLLTWWATVRSEITRASASSALVSPSASRRATSSSRAVRPPGACRVEGRGPRAIRIPAAPQRRLGERELVGGAEPREDRARPLEPLDAAGQPQRARLVVRAAKPFPRRRRPRVVAAHLLEHDAGLR